MAAEDRDRWNDQWAEAGGRGGRGSKLADLLEPWLPEAGRLLDVAGGGAPDSLEFARRGLDVTVCDVSDVGLAQARERASAEDLHIETITADLEVDSLPAGPWAVITVANYLQRDLLAVMAAALAPGGILGVMISTTTNLERHDRPGGPYLLEPGELPTLVPDLEILHNSEAWRANNRHEAHLVARATTGV